MRIFVNSFVKFLYLKKRFCHRRIPCILFVIKYIQTFDLSVIFIVPKIRSGATIIVLVKKFSVNFFEVMLQIVINVS